MPSANGDDDDEAETQLELPDGIIALPSTNKDGGGWGTSKHERKRTQQKGIKQILRETNPQKMADKLRAHADDFIDTPWKMEVPTQDVHGHSTYLAPFLTLDIEKGTASWASDLAKITTTADGLRIYHPAPLNSLAKLIANAEINGEQGVFFSSQDVLRTALVHGMAEFLRKGILDSMDADTRALCTEQLRLMKDLNEAAKEQSYAVLIDERFKALKDARRALKPDNLPDIPLPGITRILEERLEAAIDNLGHALGACYNYVELQQKSLRRLKKAAPECSEQIIDRIRAEASMRETFYEVTEED